MTLSRFVPVVLVVVAFSWVSLSASELSVEAIARWARSLEEGDPHERQAALFELAVAATNERDVPLLRSRLQPLLAQILTETEARLTEDLLEEEMEPDEPGVEVLTEQKAQTLLILTRIADETTIHILVDHLGTGRMVANGLARLGLPAVEPVLGRMERDPRSLVSGSYVLTEILRRDRERSGGAEDLFEREVLPRLQAMVSRIQDDDTLVGRARDISLAHLKEVVRFIEGGEIR